MVPDVLLVDEDEDDDFFEESLTHEFRAMVIVKKMRVIIVFIKFSLILLVFILPHQWILLILRRVRPHPLFPLHQPQYRYHHPLTPRPQP